MHVSFTWLVIIWRRHDVWSKRCQDTLKILGPQYVVITHLQEPLPVCRREDIVVAIIAPL